jgi:hypothetical protein
MFDRTFLTVTQTSAMNGMVICNHAKLGNAKNAACEIDIVLA